MSAVIVAFLRCRSSSEAFEGGDESEGEEEGGTSHLLACRWCAVRFDARVALCLSCILSALAAHFFSQHPAFLSITPLLAPTHSTMTSSIVPSQWAFRSQKAVGIATGAPTFTSSVASNEELRQTARVVAYSPDGSLLAAAFDDAVRLVATASDDNVNVLHSLAASKVVDMRFSPRGRFLSTWERPAKDAEGNPTRNLCVWDTATGARLAAFERKSQDGW